MVLTVHEKVATTHNSGPHVHGPEPLKVVTRAALSSTLKASALCTHGVLSGAAGGPLAECEGARMLPTAATSRVPWPSSGENVSWIQEAAIKGLNLLRHSRCLTLTCLNLLTLRLTALICATTPAQSPTPQWRTHPRPPQVKLSVKLMAMTVQASSPPSPGVAPPTSTSHPPAHTPRSAPRCPAH